MSLINELNIIKNICNITEYAASQEQLSTTDEFFYQQYAGSNPLVEAAKDLNAWDQLLIATKGIAFETYKAVRSSESDLNLAMYNYLGYSKNRLLEILTNLIMNQSISKEDRFDTEAILGSIIDKLDVSLMKTFLLCMLVLLHYESDEAVGVLAYYLYTATKLSA